MPDWVCPVLNVLYLQYSKLNLNEYICVELIVLYICSFSILLIQKYPDQSADPGTAALRRCLKYPSCNIIQYPKSEALRPPHNHLKIAVLDVCLKIA